MTINVMHDFNKEERAMLETITTLIEITKKTQQMVATYRKNGNKFTSIILKVFSKFIEKKLKKEKKRLRKIVEDVHGACWAADVHLIDDLGGWINPILILRSTLLHPLTEREFKKQLKKQRKEQSSNR